MSRLLRYFSIRANLASRDFDQGTPHDNLKWSAFQMQMQFDTLSGRFFVENAESIAQPRRHTLGESGPWEERFKLGESPCMIVGKKEATNSLSGGANENLAERSVGKDVIYRKRPAFIGAFRRGHFQDLHLNIVFETHGYKSSVFLLKPTTFWETRRNRPHKKG
jgi:hypothetical protein